MPIQMLRAPTASTALLRSSLHPAPVPVCDACNCLVNDGACVQFRCRKMRRGTDDLDATFMGSMVGTRSLEGWKEGVVDIDGVLPVTAAKGGAEDLHIASQDEQVDPLSSQELFKGRFLSILAT